jgi:hypothetical protein
MAAASRSIDDDCARFFYVTTDSRTYEYSNDIAIDDLLSLSTVNGNPESEYTYTLYPINETRKTSIVFESMEDDVTDGIVLGGQYGYSDDTTVLVALQSFETGLGTENQVTMTCDANSTIIPLSLADNLSAGVTILVESEQMFVRDVDVGTELITVYRGQNGTTAVSHSSALVNVYQYPPAIKQESVRRTVQLFRHISSAGIISERLGDHNYSLETPQNMIDRSLLLIGAYRRIWA